MVLNLKELRKQKACLYLVINMAFADIMLGAVSIPLFVSLKVAF